MLRIQKSEPRSQKGGEGILTPGFWLLTSLLHDVTAPSAADDTTRAYFASTPLV